MADAVYLCRNSVFSAATGAKTALKILAGANQPFQIIEWGISFDGTTSTATPATVTLEQSTEAGAGTGAASPPAIVQVGGNKNITAQITSAHNFTAEPSALTVVEQVFVPQYMGIYVKQYPLGQEPESDLSGTSSGVKAMCIRVNSTATVNVLAYARVTIGA